MKEFRTISIDAYRPFPEGNERLPYIGDAIERASDDLSKDGGGTIFIPAGTYTLIRKPPTKERLRDGSD